jgi:hypothetical protein
MVSVDIFFSKLKIINFRFIFLFFLITLLSNSYLADEQEIIESLNAPSDEKVTEINGSLGSKASESVLLSESFEENSKKIESIHNQEDFGKSKSDIDFSENYLFILLSILTSLLLLLFIVIYFLAREVRWRRRFSKSDSVVFPNAHLDFLEKLNIYFAELANSVQDSQNKSLILQRESNSLSEQVMDSISKFNDVIDNQKIEIDRLREGYDFSIRKKTIMSLIETKELLEKFLGEDPNQDSKEMLNKVVRYVESYLEEFDVEEFSIEQGRFFRDLPSENFEIEGTETTKDKNLDGKVFKTSNSGYAFIHENGKTVIKKASILVYKNEE